MSAASISPATANLVHIDGVSEPVSFVPSRFNARTTAPDGTLVLYNSFTGAFTGFPGRLTEQVERLLSQTGFRSPVKGITKYLYERGYVVHDGTDELDRVRLLYGNQHHRSDQLELILLTSEECNFRCVYCYETFPRGTMEPWVRSSVIQMVERRAKRLNTFSASYFGGEPLLGLEAIEELAPAFKRICEEHDIGKSSAITTNAYLLNPDLFNRLVEWDIRMFQITIDGAPSDHDQHRILKGGGDTFHTIFENVLATQASKEDFRVVLRVNFDHENLPRMEEFLGMLEPLKNDPRYILRFYPVGTWGGPNDDDLEICGLQGERERQRLDVRATELGLTAESRMPYLESRSGMGVCYAARPFNLLIGADGKIMKCTVALDT
ncbi:MAG TPA: radical SAM protein, partial [Bryobacteraceae bacterium]